MSLPIELRWRRVPAEHESPGFGLPSEGEDPPAKVILEYRCMLPKPHGITMGKPADEWSDWMPVPEVESYEDL